MSANLNLNATADSFYPDWFHNQEKMFDELETEFVKHHSWIFENTEQVQSISYSQQPAKPRLLQRITTSLNTEK